MKKRILLVLVLLPLLGFSQPEKACFSVPGGFYEDRFTLEMFPFYQNHHIRYTTNGNRPTAQSQLYTGPLLLDEHLYSTSDIFTIQVAPDKDMYYPDDVERCIVIRAAVFDADENCISEVATNSYFIQSLGCDTHGLPAVSLCADSLDLFDYNHGIMVPGAWFSPAIEDWTGNYYCTGSAWEKPCNVEFYEADNTGVNQIAGLRTHGGASRRYQQKGFKLFARKEYGENRFDHLFFPENAPMDSYKHLSLKPFRCSNWMMTGIQDHLAQQVARTLDVDCLASRQAVLFLNGEYWGIYALEETPDERYLEDHYLINAEESTIVKKWIFPEHGDDTQWNALFQWMGEADLSDDENYRYLCDRIDIDNFIDYQIFELYSGNVDWPRNNVRCWQGPNHKWRWIFYDGDGCFFSDWDAFANAVDHDTVSKGDNPSSMQATLFFRKLLKNTDFSDRFESRFYQAMDDVLQYERISPIFKALCALIAEEVPKQSARFGFPSSVAKWESDVSRVDEHLSTLNVATAGELSHFMNALDYPNERLPIQCFPNPFDGLLNLRVVTVASKACDLCVFDIMGQEVYRVPVLLNAGINKLTLNLPLSSGVYFIMTDQYIAKIVKQ